MIRILNLCYTNLIFCSKTIKFDLGIIFVKQKRILSGQNFDSDRIIFVKQMFFLFFGNTGFFPVNSKQSLVVLVTNNSSKEKYKKKSFIGNKKNYL